MASLKGEVDAIIHCANCHCTMGSGVAKAIVHEMPMVKWCDDETCSITPEDKLGTFSHVYTRGVHVYNAYGQLDYHPYKRQVNYGALAESLTRIKLDLLQNEDQFIKIGIPLIGAGLAGGDWSIISELVAHIFKDFDITVYVLDEKLIPSKEVAEDKPVQPKRMGRPPAKKD